MTIITDTQIIDDIMQKIVEKTLVPGKKLPSENDLADHYRVPRMTVRSALTKLEERGLLYSVQGKGRYLREKSKQIQLPLNGKISFTEKMEQLGFHLTTKNIGCTAITYDEKVFQILQAEKTDRVYRISRVRYIDDEPIAIHSSFVKTSDFPMIESDGPAITSMFAYYRKFGFNEFTSGKSILSTSFPTTKEQQLLDCKSLVPLIIIETNSIDKRTNKVLEFTKIIYRSDKFNYDITNSDSN